MDVVVNSSDSSVSKRMKLSRTITNEEEMGEDRISSLPNSLLIHIISLLGDTKEVVRDTCLLSKRWKYLWTELTEVQLCASRCFNRHRKKNRYVKEVVNRFWKVLAMCKNLNKVCLSLNHHEKCFYSCMNDWVYFLIKSKVTDVTLDCHRYELPQMVYSYSLLTNLMLDGCIIAPQRIIAWRSLKSLCFNYMSISDSVMEMILAGCPVLEVLKLDEINILDNLNIYSPNLTTLEWKHIVDEAHISAPYLLVLSIHVFDLKHMILSNVSSVVQADLDSLDEDEDPYLDEKICMPQMLHSLRSLQSVEKLELANNCFLVASLMEDNGFKLPLFTKLRCLTLVVCWHVTCVPGIIAILRCSPMLETLHISGSCWPSEIPKEKYTISSMNCNMDLVASHLKTVEITNFSEEDLDVEYMLTLVETLLKSAKVLKEMVICVSYPSHSINISERVATFLRASPTATVVFC